MSCRNRSCRIIRGFGAPNCAPTISARILQALRKVGVPYTDDMIANASPDAYGQAAPDTPYAEGVTKRYGEATNVRAFDGKPGELTELDALVAYLQILGKLTDAAHKPSPRRR